MSINFKHYFSESLRENKTYYHKYNNGHDINFHDLLGFSRILKIWKAAIKMQKELCQIQR